jgi:hypothetical protein
MVHISIYHYLMILVQFEALPWVFLSTFCISQMPSGGSTLFKFYSIESYQPVYWITALYGA